MKSEVPTLDELARVTGQTKGQLARDIRAAGDPRGKKSADDVADR